METPTAPLDFAALLSRDHRPARVTYLTPREAFKPDGRKGTDDEGKKGRIKSEAERYGQPTRDKRADGEAEATKLVMRLVSQTPMYTKHVESDDQYSPYYRHQNQDGAVPHEILEMVRTMPRKAREDWSTLPPALHAVELGDWENKICWEGLKDDTDDDNHNGDKGKDRNGSAKTNENGRDDNIKTIGKNDGLPDTPTQPSKKPQLEQSSKTKSDLEDEKEKEREPFDPSTLLMERRNPYLDAFTFDDDNGGFDWEGDRAKHIEKSKHIPLILELGTAGQSIARHGKCIYICPSEQQRLKSNFALLRRCVRIHETLSESSAFMFCSHATTVLPVSRPTPFGQSDAYLQRYKDDWAAPVVSTAELSKGTLHADKEKMAALIAQRQKKRAQMAKDKTTRVTQALGTLQLGGGKGRTITSSLMGPGGTERTGRPARHTGSSAHDAEFIEQLDMVYNHQYSKPEMSFVELRQFHRPKLPLIFVRRERSWQLQIRYIPSPKKSDSTGNQSSYMMSSHAGR